MRDRLVYLDTNFFVYIFSKDSEEVKKLVKGMEQYKLFTSCLTYDEFVWTIKKLLGKESALMAADFILSIKPLKFLVVTKNTLLISKRAMTTYDLDPRDSIHYASMLLEEIFQIVSEDRDFKNIPNIQRIDCPAFFKQLV